MYGKEQRVKQDTVEAVIWLRMAADRGHVEVEYLLGVIYYFGEGVTQDHPEALNGAKKPH